MTHPNDAALRAEIAKLKADNQALIDSLAAKSKAPPLTAKISKKGCVSVYGLNRTPVSLYAEQWTKLFGIQDQINALIALPEAEKAKLQAAALQRSIDNPFVPKAK